MLFQKPIEHVLVGSFTGQQVRMMMQHYLNTRTPMVLHTAQVLHGQMLLRYDILAH